MISGTIFEGRALIEGRAAGEAEVLEEPLSFWGGVDPESGTIVERRHPQHGTRLTGKVLVMPSGRGSSSSSNVFAEAIRAGTAPAAIVLSYADGIIALGAVVARELYGTVVPVVVLGAPEYAQLTTGAHVTIDGARVSVVSRPPPSGG